MTTLKEQPVETNGGDKGEDATKRLGFGAIDDPSVRWSTGATLFLIVGIVVLLRLEPEDVPAQDLENVRTVLFGFLVVVVISWLLNLVRVSRGKPHPHGDVGSLWNIPNQLYTESHAMAAHALEQGKGVQPGDVNVIDEAAGFYYKRDWSGQANLIRELAHTHTRLAGLVAPAMPKTLALLKSREQQPLVFPWLGSVHLVRMLLGIAVALIPLFVLLGISVGTRLDTSEGLFSGNIIEKTQTATYLIVAAALGAAFAGLFTAFRFISNLDYDNKYESAYWVRFVLGVVAGLILAVILAQALFPDGGDDAGLRLTVPLLALVGGFSSDLVYRILKRIIDAIGTLVEGSGSERVEAEKQKSETRLKAQELEDSQSLAAKVLEIRESLPDDADEAQAKIMKILSEVLNIEIDLTDKPRDGVPIEELEEEEEVPVP